ncbi:hypothetical protein SAMN04488090_2697 [Siphonobacter aquaeclarae]|uniref:Uncharacterized protein n=2 Tax=Siphonobacter aquaeclarae TaxID=563176 RepID=A0A1G9R288_9BACT|nr:hypothetical protein SAMN04488090_2697 [Siphonobacter aquaeclarae]
MSLSPSVPRSWDRPGSLSLGIPLYVYACVASSLCIVVGLLWDISWHITIGRDGLFSAPHNLIYAGAAFAGLFAGYRCLMASFGPHKAERPHLVHFWGIFYSSLGGLFCIWGSIAALTSAPFDDWWHSTYGLDVEIFTPPHTVLILGLMTIQLGAMFLVMALLNREDDAVFPERTARLRLLFTLTAGFLLAMLYLFVSEFVDRVNSHNAIYYQVSGLVFPLFLFSTARASGHRWGATRISLVYMLVLLLTNWVLQQFPAEPLLGPILNPVTHFQFFGFPVLLILPAACIDWLQQRVIFRNNWTRAFAMALVFALVYGLIQWFFGEFLVSSPLARNKFFGSYTWYFGNDPNWEYRYQYYPWAREAAGDLATGLGIAFLITLLSTRVGLAWGNWMKKVVR